MKLIKVAAATLNQTPLDWDGNAARVRRALAMAREAGASVVCLPELCLTGYGCEDAFHSPHTARMAARMLAEVLPDTRGLVACVGLPLLHRNALFNAAALAVDGRLVGFAAKQNLAGDGLHYEPRWFKAWPRGRVTAAAWDATRSLLGDDAEGAGGAAEMLPLGDIYFDVGGVRLGFEICEDAWVAARPGGALSGKAVDIILNPSASHFAFGKHDVRQRFVLEGSRAFGVAYIYANLLGNEAGRAIYDGGGLIASGGEMAAQGPRFSFDDVTLTTAVVDLERSRLGQARRGSHVPDLDDDPACVRTAFAWPAARLEGEPPQPPEWEHGAHVEFEEFARAVALGLFDYLRKSHARGYVVSLSGGADSAACAVLVSLMVRWGVEELGLKRFIEKIGGYQNLQDRTSPKELTRALLMTVYQATANSTPTTREAARAVAEAIGARHHEFDVEALVQGYMALVQEAAGRRLTWDEDDMALQNIQARVRAPGVWMMANIAGAILITTSNRSEAAVGYATMDGDTAGGLAPIAGIDKHFLRGWLRWMESRGPAGLTPIPTLRLVNAQQPTAELRPAGAGQTDEGDLMPYDILEAIEDAAIRDKQSPREVLMLMTARFPQHGETALREWVAKFFRLWSRNQWKRERYAPSFHVDDKNLDPKTWCRFPILSGGFEKEIREMEQQGGG